MLWNIFLLIFTKILSTIVLPFPFCPGGLDLQLGTLSLEDHSWCWRCDLARARCQGRGEVTGAQWRRKAPAGRWCGYEARCLSLASRCSPATTADWGQKSYVSARGKNTIFLVTWKLVVKKGSSNPQLKK